MLLSKLGKYYDEYLGNKKTYESDPNSPAALAAAERNQAIRNDRGILSDDYSYDGLRREASYGDTMYTDDLNKTMAALGNYTRYKDPYNTGDLRRKLENFNYNPETDPAFQSYRDMYARQGQAAQGQTLANLTSLSGGRNNSWASAATAQVGQAYAQKTADIVPQLAQQAYEKLLQRYNIEASESDRAYGRWQDIFGRTRDMADLYATLDQQAKTNERQKVYDDIYYRESDRAYGSATFDDNLKRMFGEDKERESLEYLKQQRDYLGKQGDYLGKQINWYDRLQEESWKSQKQQNEYYPRQAEANIAATNRSGTGGGGRAPTTYEYQQSAKNEVSQLLYPEKIPEGLSPLYFPIQELQKNRGSMTSETGKDYIDSLIITEAAKIAKAEGKSVNQVLREQGFSDLVEY